MNSRIKIIYKIKFILVFIAFFFFFISALYPVYALSIKEKDLTAGLRKPKDLPFSESNSKNISQALQYLIGLDDILGITVWQNLSGQKTAEGILQQKEYTINKGDVLEISVWQWPDLIKDVIVRPDGKISFPLVGDVQAEGLTLDELKLSLSEKLSGLVSNPDVFIQINEFAGNKVIILGEVGDPGVYPTASSIKILEALSLASGHTKDAILRNVFVLRGNLNNPQVIKVNLSKAIKGKDFSQNIPIQPRDIIYVPRSFISDVNYVLTQLIGPLTSSASAVSGIKTIRTRPSTKK